MCSVIRYRVAGILFIGLCGVNSLQATTVNINGNVMAAPCLMDGADSQAVDFETIDASTLKTAGSASAIKFFDLKLKDCPASTTKVTASFIGSADKDNANYFINTGTATGVAVQVKDVPSAWASNTLTPTGGASLTVNINGTEHTAIFPLVARMVSPKGDARSGSVQSAMQVNFTYQ